MDQEKKPSTGKRKVFPSKMKMIKATDTRLNQRREAPSSIARGTSPFTKNTSTVNKNAIPTNRSTPSSVKNTSSPIRNNFTPSRNTSSSVRSNSPSVARNISPIAKKQTQTKSTLLPQKKSIQNAHSSLNSQRKTAAKKITTRSNVDFDSFYKQKQESKRKEALIKKSANAKASLDRYEFVPQRFPGGGDKYQTERNKLVDGIEGGAGEKYKEDMFANALATKVEVEKADFISLDRNTIKSIPQEEISRPEFLTADRFSSGISSINEDEIVKSPLFTKDRFS